MANCVLTCVCAPCVCMCVSGDGDVAMKHTESFKSIDTLLCFQVGPGVQILYTCYVNSFVVKNMKRDKEKAKMRGDESLGQHLAYIEVLQDTEGSLEWGALGESGTIDPGMGRVMGKRELVIRGGLTHSQT